MRMKLADFPEVQALSAREKLELADELWQDAAHDLESLEVSAAEKKLLDERWAAYRRDPSSALTLEQFKAKVKKRRA
jgi:putative addiction module component (TIGR02574 family)